MSALFDFPALVIVLLLLICTSAYVRAATFNNNTKASFLDGFKHGAVGIPWKAARVGERLSPWVSLACVTAAVYVLFIK
jgi:hypothetical protein